MKNITVLALSVCAIFTAALAFGADETVPATNVVKRQVRRSGGILDKKGDGKIVIVDAQNLIGAKTIEDSVGLLQRVTHYNFEIRKGTWDFGSGAQSDANVTIYLVEDEKLPMSIVAVEARWGVVNVRNLDKGKRFAMEFSRVFCIVGGAACSQNKLSALQTVVCVEDLDKLGTPNIPSDTAMVLFKNMENLGVTRGKKFSYRKACEQGWAPAPTNDIQKAIWDEVHAAPKNPMKIEFDPKKGR